MKLKAAMCDINTNSNMHHEKYQMCINHTFCEHNFQWALNDDLKMLTELNDHDSQAQSRDYLKVAEVYDIKNNASGSIQNPRHGQSNAQQIT